MFLYRFYWYIRTGTFTSNKTPCSSLICNENHSPRHAIRPLRWICFDDVHVDCSSWTCQQHSLPHLHNARMILYDQHNINIMQKSGDLCRFLMPHSRNHSGNLFWSLSILASDTQPAAMFRLNHFNFRSISGPFAISNGKET